MLLRTLGAVALWAALTTSAAWAQCAGPAGVPFNCQLGQTPQPSDIVLGGATTGTYVNHTVDWTWNQVFSAGLTFGLSASFGTVSASGAVSFPDGGTLGGTFVGSPTFSGNVSIVGSGNALSVTNQVQAFDYITGDNLQAPSSSALTALFNQAGHATGTVSGSGAWNQAGVSSDTANFSGATDNAGKLWNLQYNVSGTANGSRVGVWSQINPSSLSNALEILPLYAKISANSAMANSLLQPLATTVTVGASATNVGNTVNEMDYAALASAVGIKGALQITLSTGDVDQGVSADAGLFFSNANVASGSSAGMQAAIGLGNTDQAFPLGTDGYVINFLPQTANGGSGQNTGFIPAQATGGIHLQDIYFTGNSFDASGFSVTGQDVLSLGQLVVTPGASGVTIDTPLERLSSASISNGGTGSGGVGCYYAGDLVFDTYGNIFQVATVSGCQAASLAIKVRGYTASPPGSAVSMSGGSGTGLTVTETYAVASAINLGTTSASAVNIGNSSVTTTVNGTLAATTSKVNTTTNCASGASPAVCSGAVSGSSAVPTGTNPTLVVDTTAVTANSVILVTPDESLGTKLSVTCNGTITTQGPIAVTARSPGTSFTVEVDATVATNPVCFNWMIVN